MVNRVELITLQPGTSADERERLIQALRSTASAGTQALLRPTLPGVYNGGDLLWKAPGENLAAPSPPAVAHVDGAVYEEGEGGGEWSRPGVYRALLLAVKPATSPDAVARFERELLAMPRYIVSIRAWRLSRVQQARGARPWSHLWEQRYDSLEGLTGTYMLHPYHWAWVDRWFDPESPDWIVDTHLCHSFCRLE